MLKAYRYRIYPTDEQKVLLAKTFGCCRWFYNHSLNLTNETYKAIGKGKGTAFASHLSVKEESPITATQGAQRRE